MAAIVYQEPFQTAPGPTSAIRAVMSAPAETVPMSDEIACDEPILCVMVCGIFPSIAPAGGQIKSMSAYTAVWIAANGAFMMPPFSMVQLFADPKGQHY